MRRRFSSLPLSVLAVASVVAAAATPSIAQAPSGGLRACIDAAGASWTPYDDHTILVRSNGRPFLVTTNRCPRLAGPTPRIITKMQGGISICSPHDVWLSVGDGAGIPTPCFVQSIAPITEEQARALEHRSR